LRYLSCDIYLLEDERSDKKEKSSAECGDGGASLRAFARRNVVLIWGVLSKAAIGVSKHTVASLIDSAVGFIYSVYSFKQTETIKAC